MEVGRSRPLIQSQMNADNRRCSCPPRGSWSFQRLEVSAMGGSSLNCRGRLPLADVLAVKALVISAFICVHLRFTKTALVSSCGCAALCPFAPKRFCRQGGVTQRSQPLVSALEFLPPRPHGPPRIHDVSVRARRMNWPAGASEPHKIYEPIHPLTRFVVRYSTPATRRRRVAGRGIRGRLQEFV